MLIENSCILFLFFCNKLYRRPVASQAWSYLLLSPDFINDTCNAVWPIHFDYTDIDFWLELQGNAADAW